MYYPIIDKLKEVMADIISVKEKEPLVIEGTLTTQTNGIWEGNYSDILSAFGNRPVYFKMIMPTGDTFFIPLVQINNTSVYSCLLVAFNVSSFGVLYSDNTFELETV